MTNNREQQQKDGIMKSLAIAGFIGLIIVVAWLGIKVVQSLPNAFSSLASLADSVYNYDTSEFKTLSTKGTVSTDESVTINWNISKRTGTFAFSYQCADGLSVEMRDSLGAIKTLACDTNYNIGSVKALDIVAQSEKNRFTDLKYRIDFIPTGKESPAASDESSITIVNATISAAGLATNEGNATSTDDNTDEDTTSEVTTDVKEPVVVTKPTTPTKPVTPTTTTKPVYVQKPVYGIPTSDPNGYTDLDAKFVASGMLINNVFSSAAIINNNQTGAIRFSVQNVGTKTSNSWTYTAKLPNGEIYQSPSQSPLKPNERAVITIGFPMSSATGVSRYNVEVAVTPDNNRTNNQFSTVIAVVN